MEHNEGKAGIGPLKKVVLLLEAGRGAEHLDFAPEPLRCAVIYGIGVLGLSPLESTLSGKKEGDVCLVRLKKNELSDFFQHVPIPSLGIPEGVESFTLKITVAELSLPDQREVVRAMADMANCGSHCCGHHAST